MHEPLLRRAANPAPYRVLGLRLKPYSLGHQLLLAEEESGPDLPLPVALAKAVWICSNTWKQNRALRCDPLAARKLDFWRWLRRHADCAAEALAFRRYVAAGSLQFPVSDFVRTERLEPAGPPCGSPPLLALHDFLVERFQLSDAAAWDHPFGYAKMRWQTAREQEGLLHIQTAGESKFDRIARAEREREGN